MTLPVSAKKLSYFINSFILLLVFGLTAFFVVCEFKALVYFSIPTILVYLFSYILIAKDKLYHHVYLVIFWITLYMCVTTVFLGYGCGFHLYCFSMIPVSFVIDYMAYKMKAARINAKYLSIGIGAAYLLCTGHVSRAGSVYTVEDDVASVFWLFNAAAVLFFLIYFSNFMMRSVVISDDKLEKAAMTDRLTGLYNRHYILNRLDDLKDDDMYVCLAIVDIDDFKKINDVYGHNTGDEVLRRVSEMMREECGDCIIARWGGEEFLILMKQDEASAGRTAEHMRERIASESIHTDSDLPIHVTVTVGLSQRAEGRSIDEWTKDIDEKLYVGKNSGKNRVVI